MLAVTVGTAAHGQAEDTQLASETVGFSTFREHCVQSFEWATDPGLEEMSESDVSQAEQHAISPHGDRFKYFRVSNEPRVILGIQWQEQRLGRNVVGVSGRCVVFSYEVAWDGMPSAMEGLTGIAPDDNSMPDQNLDNLMFLNIANLRANPREIQPMAYAVSRLTESDSEINGTTMYRAMM